MLEQIDIPNCTINQLKNKVYNLKRNYADVILWRNQTGQGVKENDGEESFISKFGIFITKRYCSH